MKTLLVIAALLAGCSTSMPPKDTTTTTAARPCPLGVEGATMTVEDTTEGVALTFTAANVEEMRERARNASALHGPQRLGAGHGGRHGQGGQHGLQPLQLPPSYAGMDEIEGGARIRLIPVDPADRELLRARVRARAFAMGTVSCEERRR